MDICQQIVSFLESLYGSPIPPMMLIWGLILVFLSAGGRIAGIVAARKWRWLLLIFGIVLLALSLRIYVRPLPPNALPTPPPTPNPADIAADEWDHLGLAIHRGPGTA